MEGRSTKCKKKINTNAIYLERLVYSQEYRIILGIMQNYSVFEFGIKVFLNFEEPYQGTLSQKFSEMLHQESSPKSLSFIYITVSNKKFKSPQKCLQ